MIDISRLKTGDIVRHKSDGNAYVVLDATGDKAYAVRRVTVTNPAEWLLIDQDTGLPVEDKRELLPCPFCGSAARLTHDTSSDYERHWRWSVECTNYSGCEVSITGCSTDMQAAERWNRRVAYIHRDRETEVPTVTGSSREVEVNHQEALELACLKRDVSNLARCYLDLRLYRHRNGETQPPDEDHTGYFWFTGSVKNSDCIYVITELVECWSTVVGNQTMREILPKNAYNGKWWGLVVPPWKSG